MIKNIIKIFIVLPLLIFYSCKHQKENSCKKNFTKGLELIQTKSTSSPSLDTALQLMNESLKCKNYRLPAIDFKIRILLMTLRHNQATLFVDSLAEEDFLFGYQKAFTLSAIKVQKNISSGDSILNKGIYEQMIKNMDSYRIKNGIAENEFNDFYTNYFEVKQKFLSADQYKREIDSMRTLYPGKERIFSFF